MQSEETVLASYGPTKTAILTVLRHDAALAASPRSSTVSKSSAAHAQRRTPPAPMPMRARRAQAIGGVHGEYLYSARLDNQHGQNGRLGGAIAVQHGLLRLHLKA